MAVLCGMPTIQYSARSAWPSVRLSMWASKDNKWSKQFDIRRIAAVDAWFNVIRQVTAMCPLPWPAANDILRVPQFSSKSLHVRRSYSRTREHRPNAP